MTNPLDDLTKAIDAEEQRRDKDKELVIPAKDGNQPTIIINFGGLLGGLNLEIPMNGLIPDYCADCQKPSSSYNPDCACACHSTGGI